jgi:glycosyltransferase involved in cell wall biosynthesis
VVKPMTKPNVLVLMPYAMAPARNGGSEKAVATYANLNSLANVTLVWPESRKGFGLAKLPGGCLQFSIGLEPDIVQAIEEDRSSWGTIGWSAALAKHISKSKAFCEGVRHFSKNTEIIILSHQWLIDSIPEEFKGRLILDSFGSEPDLLREQLSEGDPNFQYVRTLYYKELIDLTSQIEKRAIERSSEVFAMTQVEADGIVSKYPKKTVKLNLTGTDLQESPIFKIPTGKPNFLFFGSAHPPNIGAAIFVQKLSERNTDINFTIAGEVSNYLQSPPPNLKLFSEVSDDLLRELIETSTGFLNPIASGSGVSLKSLRILASGLPMISTPLGVRGLQVRNNQEVVITNLDSFDSEIRKLIYDTKHWATLNLSSLAFAAENLDWKSISHNFAKLVLDNSFNDSEFNYLPVDDFRDYNCLKWLALNKSPNENFSNLGGYLTSSNWTRSVKPFLKRATPESLRKFIKRFL